MAVPYTSKFILAYPFREVILDKDTAAPLAGGIVTFYRDLQRTTLKPVYKITEDPIQGYQMVELQNPMTLSSIGTFQDDSGNDIAIYFYPYDDLGQPDNYFITCFSSLDGVTPAIEQFTRSNIPGVISQSDGAVASLKNYIANGQFLIHNDVVNVADSLSWISGQITQNNTVIALPNFQYETDNYSGVDTVTFLEQPITDIPAGNPRYTCRLTSNGVSSSSYKYLSIIFQDVSKFANNSYYTLSFSMRSNISSVPISVGQRKYFGSGGSPTTVTTLGSILVTPSFQMYNIAFSPGTNTGSSLGTGGDTYSLLIILPTNLVYDVEITDIALTDGSNTLETYPVTPDEEFSYTAISGSLVPPDYAGYDLYLPRVLTPNGEVYDNSFIGKIYINPTESPDITELECDGSSYDTDTYDVRSGIPYRRLYNRWADPITGLSVTSNGNGFYLKASASGSILTVAAYYVSSSVTYQLHLTDGAISTGFTFGIPSGNPEVTNITVTAASSITDGSYFTYQDRNVTKYYVWLNKGESNDPKPAGFAKRLIVYLDGTEDANGVVVKIAKAMNGKWVQLPDYRGFFLRAWDHGRGLDPDSASRGDRADAVVHGDHVGTTQSDTFESHKHDIQVCVQEPAPFYADGTNRFLGPASIYANDLGGYPGHYLHPDSMTNSGGNETRPTNIYVMYVVRY